MVNRILVLSNFNAGRRKAIKYKKTVLKFVLKHTKDFKFIDIDELGNTDISQYDTILVVGGDGTINKVLPYLKNTDKVLGIIPAGTANLLAAKLGFSYSLQKNLQIIEDGNIKIIDMIDINGENCILRCGFGYDSDIICKTPQSLKNKFGYFAYFIAGILFALRLKKKKYEIIINENTKEIEASCIILANAGNMYRNFMSVGKDSKLDDGLIDIFILKTTNPIVFFVELLLIALNIHKSSNRAEYLQADKIQIKNILQTFQADGEKKKLKGNITAKICPMAVRVLCKK